MNSPFLFVTGPGADPKLSLDVARADPGLLAGAIKADATLGKTLTEAINYITPVPAVQDIIKSDAASAKGSDKATLEAVATSPLVWLSAADYARLKNYVPITSKNQSTFYGTVLVAGATFEVDGKPVLIST